MDSYENVGGGGVSYGGGAAGSAHGGGFIAGGYTSNPAQGGYNSSGFLTSSNYPPIVNGGYVGGGGGYSGSGGGYQSQGLPSGPPGPPSHVSTGGYISGGVYSSQIPPVPPPHTSQGVGYVAGYQSQGPPGPPLHVSQRGYAGSGRYQSQGPPSHTVQGEFMLDTVFVSGLPKTATETDIADYFGLIGSIKKDKKTGKDKIRIYREKESGQSKGEATVTYEDPPTANSSISWFNGKEFRGSTIKVEMAQKKISPGGYGRGRGRGGTGKGRGRGGHMNGGFGRGGGGGPGQAGPVVRHGGGVEREGDWNCPNPALFLPPPYVIFFHPLSPIPPHPECELCLNSVKNYELN